MGSIGTWKWYLEIKHSKKVKVRNVPHYPAEEVEGGFLAFTVIGIIR